MSSPINDIVSERYKYFSMTKNNESISARENRSHQNVEILADSLVEKFNAPESRKAFLAVGYSGLPGSFIEASVVTALEVGKSPVKLFMHLISQTSHWKEYQAKKQALKNRYE